MANKQHLAILEQGVEAWNKWMSSDWQIPDLRGAILVGINLTGADLTGADLTGANLTDANLSGALLDEVQFCGANLSRANLSMVTLIHANLALADLRKACFCGLISHGYFAGANLCGAFLLDCALFNVCFRDADFQGAAIGRMAFADCDLRNAKGLDKVEHIGPSVIGIDTIYRSNGLIPESFLRGCGVPESFITQMHSLVGAEDGIQFYSCFISYSSKDDEFARRLHGRMREAHLRVWFAPEDIQGGQKLHEQIETAIRVYDKLLIVLSEASLQSEWVMTELRKARKAERQSGKRKLFPVRLVDFDTIREWECFDADGGKDLAVELREYFIPDFSRWKDHDQFEASFARLLNDLKSETTTGN
jgi:hypothetical protein